MMLANLHSTGALVGVAIANRIPLFNLTGNIGQTSSIEKFKRAANRPTGIDVLTAEQVYLAGRLTLRIAEATRYADVVALFQALGGGWWNRLDVDGRGLTLSHP
jgi:outer membrane protein TolC